MDYAWFVRGQLSGCRTCRLIAHLAAALLLAAELWGVSSALTDRGADVCLSRTSAADPRAHALEKPCVAELLAADAAGGQRLALHLRGNCQGERNKAKMAPRYPAAELAFEQSRSICSVVIGS